MLATREKFWNNSNQKTTFLHSHKKKKTENKTKKCFTIHVLHIDISELNSS